MKNQKAVLAAIAMSLAACVSFAQQAAPASAPAQAAAQWKYKTQRLDRAAVDKLLAEPQKLVVIDVRRPDELTAKGGFPVYLNIQAKEVAKSLAYIPKDRTILTVSNHAHRAGAVGDLLTEKGFQVAGATGSEDYEAQGGKAVVRVLPPAKPVASAQ